MILIVAEKAIAGQRIASILAGKEVRLAAEGSAQLARFEKRGEEFVMVPLRGHIAEVDFPQEFASWLGTDLKNLARAPIVYAQAEKAIIALLKKKALEASQVILATDADREGESIGVEALRYLQEKNPGIEAKRAYFSAITPKDINDAFAKLGKVDFAFADSADARREIDLIWGAVLTRFLSIASGRFGKEFLSVGRVQTPVLALIVDREKERLAFKPQKYWVLAALFEKDGKRFEAEHKKGRFWEKDEAEKILAKKTDQGTVTKVEAKERTLARPTPFNTTTFLRSATVLGLTAGEAMSIAETLYQNGLISYPRTDNAAYPATLDLKEILLELAKVKDFSDGAQKILGGKLEASRGKEAKDHPPIHPVAAAEKNRLTEKQWRIYELVCRRFFATLAEDALTLNQSVEIDLNSEPFVAHGQLVLKLGWKEFYPYSTLQEVILPELKVGDRVKLLKLDLLEKETLPPSRYSQGALIKLMEELGLGTKSTRHETLQKLYARGYISGLKAIEPNKIAFAVIDSLEKYCKKVTEPKMTAELEKEMDEIAAAKKKKPGVVEDSRLVLLGVLEVLLEKKTDIGFELKKALLSESVVARCQKCGGKLLTRYGKTGKRFLGCSSYPNCTLTYPLPQKGRIFGTEKQCEACGAPVIKVVGKRGAFEMCLNMDCKTKEEWRKKAEAKATAAENVSTGMEKQPELVGKAPIAEEKAVLVSKKAKKPAAKPAKKKVR